MSAPARSGPWTVLELIRWSTTYLVDKGIEAPRLDVEHLLAHALDTNRLQLYLDYDRPLSADELGVFKPLLLRRSKREPVQYIIGRAAFRQLDLKVDDRVLVPRPETELLVDAALEFARPDMRALDIGTGSGCIALSLALEGSFAQVVASDVSPEALELARGNATTLAETAPEIVGCLEFREGSLFSPLQDGEEFDLIVSNPPYIGTTEADALAPEVRECEPALALFAGADGLSVLEPLIAGVAPWLRPGGLLLLEIGQAQSDAVLNLIRQNAQLDNASVIRDLAGRPRIVRACRR